MITLAIYFLDVELPSHMYEGCTEAEAYQLLRLDRREATAEYFFGWR